MKVSVDETISGRKCQWMKPFLDESVFHRGKHGERKGGQT